MQSGEGGGGDRTVVNHSKEGGERSGGVHVLPSKNRVKGANILRQGR